MAALLASSSLVSCFSSRHSLLISGSVWWGMDESSLSVGQHCSKPWPGDPHSTTNHGVLQRQHTDSLCLHTLEP